MSRSRRRRLLVAVVGGSGAGKSWLAHRLCALLAPHAIQLCLDDFYRDRSHLSPAARGKVNFDHPRAIDWPRLERVLCQLQAGRPSLIPAYDFTTHCRRPESVKIRPRPVVLVEGLWLLRRRSLRRLFALSVYLDCPPVLRLRRRLHRDISLRGRNPVSVRAQFWATVEPMHRKFVQPQAKVATRVLPHCHQAEAELIADSLKRMAGL